MTLEYPEDLKYTDTHEYVRLDGEIATVGITSFAVNQLGEIVFLEIPEIGDALEKGSTFGSIESVKAVAEMYAPISGTVIERNDAIVESPEVVGEDPYGEGWLLKVQINNADELKDAMSADKYRAQVQGE
jgi:glycine cleavage system H protein